MEMAWHLTSLKEKVIEKDETYAYRDHLTNQKDLLLPKKAWL